ncbi:MAG: cheW-like domain protein [Fibrobacteres bacterium]|nr:cheW-like domain protein [Fibrobacterota bacterium]
MDAGSAGFFLIHLDGTVTSSAALAGQLSAAGGPGAPAARIPLNKAFGLNAEQELQFGKWLDLVGKRHRDMRWDKLAPLAPVQEIWSGRKEDEGPVRLAYRKLEDGNGNLIAIAVFAIDTAPSRAMVRQLEEERERHKLEIRDVLALAANPPETVGAFLEDARMRLEGARREWERFLASRARAGENQPGLWQGSVAKSESVAESVGTAESISADESAGQRLFRELHMVKGNAGAFGFESLAAGAQESEDLLEALKHPTAGSERTSSRLTASLAGLRMQLDELIRAMKLIAGEGQDAMTRILKWKLDRLVAGSAELDPARLEPPLRAVIEATRKLPFLSPAYLARKYGNLVERIAHNLGKQVNFRVTSNTGDVHPESFSRVDEALVHILRNMVDHGIESPAEREAAGKGEAEIGFEYVAEEDRIFLRIRDDGRGMDPAVIADRGVALGLLSRADADALDDVGKLGLIFLERFTTRQEADMVSGRGLGLALAARCVSDRGGNLYVYSRPGEGTRFAIELPPLGQKKLP